MNRLILPYICCECGELDVLVLDEKTWLGYKYKKSFLKGWLTGKTMCRKCSRKYRK